MCVLFHKNEALCLLLHFKFLMLYVISSDMNYRKQCVNKYLVKLEIILIGFFFLVKISICKKFSLDPMMPLDLTSNFQKSQKMDKHVKIPRRCNQPVELRLRKFVGHKSTFFQQIPCKTGKKGEKNGTRKLKDI